MDKEIIRTFGRQVKDGKLTWKEATDEFNLQTQLDLSKDAFRSRYRNLHDEYEATQEEREQAEYETHSEDGSIYLCKEVWFDANEEKTPENVLKKFGYNINEWDIVTWTFGKWEVAIKDEDQNRVCTTIRCKIKPKKQTDITLKESIEEAKKVFKENITPLQTTPRKEIKGLNENKLMELPAMELHLGKMSWRGDTGQDYDKSIAQKRFNTILEDVVYHQEQEQCGTCLLCIGNDFFNSDTVDATTTKGTPQTNDLRWKKMFNLGLEMYVNMIETLKTQFNNIDLRLVSGNHDKMSSFYLYIALSCYYKDDKVVNFTDDYKDTQCYSFGKIAIFMNHGDTNLKRIIKSIPAEFYKEWGKSIFRELHLGHLHKEVVVDDESGMITRRVGSPTGTDQWHYEERYLGATQKYQTFIWDKDKGLLNIKYINFDNRKKKSLTRVRRK